MPSKRIVCRDSRCQHCPTEQPRSTWNAVRTARKLTSNFISFWLKLKLEFKKARPGLPYRTEKYRAESVRRTHRQGLVLTVLCALANYQAPPKEGVRRGRKDSPVLTYRKASEQEDRPCPPTTPHSSTRRGIQSRKLASRALRLSEEGAGWDRKVIRWGQDSHKEGSRMSSCPARSWPVHLGHPNTAAALRSRRLPTFRDTKHKSNYFEDNGSPISHYGRSQKQRWKRGKLEWTLWCHGKVDVTT